MDHELVLPRLIGRRALETPERVFLEHVDGSSMTYGALHERSLEWAGALSSLGVRPGDTVNTMLPTSFDAIALWLGVAWLRAIEVPINTGFRGRMLDYVIGNSQAEIAVVSQRYLDRFAELGSSLPTSTIVTLDGNVDGLSDVVRTVAADDVLQPWSPSPNELPRMNDISTIMYTSGTTGPSKGVLVPWAHARASALGCFPDGELGEDDAWYGPYPLFHVSGKAPIYSMAMANGRVVLREVFSTNDYWDDVRRHRCTASLLMGSTAVFLERQPPSENDRNHPLEMVLMAPLPDDVDRFKQRFGVRVRTVFNMTEISCPIQSSWDLVDGRSCGRVADGYECRVVDDDDVPVGPGVLGELVVRASNPWTMMAGYWGMPDKTVEAWRNLWFHTGDGFTYDEDGNFYFVDRRKDAIRRRGENISSMEVEAEINLHPDVLECAVIAVPSEWSEDEVMALIVPRPGVSIDPEALWDFLAERMAKFMVPRYLRFVEDLPKTPTSKVRKAVLRDEGVTDDTWDRAALERPR